MVKFEFLKLWFMLFYIYNHDVTLTLYINWTVFLHKLHTKIGNSSYRAMSDEVAVS